MDEKEYAERVENANFNQSCKFKKMSRKNKFAQKIYKR